MLKSTYTLKEVGYGHSDDSVPWPRGLKFVVTITNTGKRDFNFGAHLHYGGYKSDEYFLEAADLNGKTVEFLNMPDIDWIVEPDELQRRNINKIVDTIQADIWHFEKGKYKLRWVCNHFGFTTLSHAEPIYSNWETIEVVN